MSGVSCASFQPVGNNQLSLRQPLDLFRSTCDGTPTTVNEHNGQPVPTLKHVLDILEELAPSSAAEDWDNPGLQVGHLSQDIEKIFISLDPTLKALRKALKRNAQLLLTHHTLVFRPISSLNREVYPGDVIFEALENGICIVAVHTNLDMVLGGIS